MDVHVVSSLPYWFPLAGLRMSSKKISGSAVSNSAEKNVCVQTLSMGTTLQSAQAPTVAKSTKESIVQGSGSKESGQAQLVGATQ